MSNAMIAYQNRIDAATLSGGSWETTLPLDNMQDRAIGKVARSTDATTASTKFQVSLDAIRQVRVIALVNHNFSLDALYRIRGYSDSGLTALVQDGDWTEVWPVVYPYESLPWESPSWWDGKYTAEEIGGYTRTLVVILPSDVLARYWLIEIDDTGNDDGYVEIGRAFMAAAWQPAVNMSWGAGIGWETETEIQPALSGAEYFDPKTPYRVARFATEHMSETDALSRAFEIQRRMGVDLEVLFIWDPEDTTHALRRQFLGRLRTLSPVDHPYVERHATAWEIKELI